MSVQSRLLQSRASSWLTVLVKCDYDECVLHEGGITKHGIDEALDPRRSVRYICVVRIVQQIRNIVHVLRSSCAEGNVFGEVLLRVPNLLAARSVVSDVVE